MLSLIGDRGAVVIGLEADVVAAPVDAFDEGVEVDGAAGVAEFFGEEVGEGVVAAADAEEAVPFDLFLGGLLKAEGED